MSEETLVGYEKNKNRVKSFKSSKILLLIDWCINGSNKLFPYIKISCHCCVLRFPLQPIMIPAFTLTSRIVEYLATIKKKMGNYITRKLIKETILGAISKRHPEIEMSMMAGRGKIVWKAY